jgi:hypothetical protein
MTRLRYWSIGDRRHRRRDQRHRQLRHQPHPGQRGALQRHLPRARHRQLPNHQQRRHPHPSASFCLQATGTDGDGSQSCFTISGHFVLDKGTGEVRRNTIISTRRVS